MLLCAFLLLINATLTNTISSILLGLVLCLVFFVTAYKFRFYDPRIPARIVALVSLINAFFCVLQIYYPAVGLSNTNLDYDLSSAVTSSLSSAFAFIPSLGRLRGIFNENGPMVLYLLLYTIFLAKLLPVFKSKRGEHFSKGDNFLFQLAIFVNVLAIVLTGSKTIVLAVPVLILLFIDQNAKGPLSSLPYFMQKLRRNPVLVFATIYLSLFLLINAIPIIVDFLLGAVLQGFVGIESRLSTDALRFTLFSNQGLLPSAEGEADSLSAYHIYTYAFGSLLSALLLSSYLFFVSRITSCYLYLLLVLIAFLASGSLLIPFYTQAILLASSTPAPLPLKMNFSE